MNDTSRANLRHYRFETEIDGQKVQLFGAGVLLAEAMKDAVTRSHAEVKLVSLRLVGVKEQDVGDWVTFDDHAERAERERSRYVLVRERTASIEQLSQATADVKEASIKAARPGYTASEIDLRAKIDTLLRVCANVETVFKKK